MPGVLTTGNGDTTPELLLFFLHTRQDSLVLSYRQQYFSDTISDMRDGGALAFLHLLKTPFLRDLTLFVRAAAAGRCARIPFFPVVSLRSW